MIAAAVVVPSVPMFLPDHVGRTDPAHDLRERCVTEIRDAVEAYGPVRVVLLTGRDDAAGLRMAPLGVRVGRHLVHLSGRTPEIVEVTVAMDADAAAVTDAADAVVAAADSAERVLLVVVADGSARRDDRAPGEPHARALEVDEAIERGLREGDPATLAGLDPNLARDVIADGRAALQVLAAAVDEAGGAVRCTRYWSDCPYGVLYVVATWALAVPASA